MRGPGGGEFIRDWPGRSLTGAIYAGQIANNRMTELCSVPNITAVLRKPSSRHGRPRGLSFRDSMTGWLAMRSIDQSRLYRTDDGGRSWRLVSLPLKALLMDAK